MKRRARIAWVVPTMRVGGTEQQLLHLIRGLSDEFETTLVCTRSEGALIGDARRAGVNVRVLGHGTAWDFRVQRPLYHAFSIFSPDIVHTFLSGFDLWANRAARRAGVPVIISSRRELATWQKWRHLFVQRRANRYVDAVVANSKAVAAYAARREGVPVDHFHIIHNGICTESFTTQFSRASLLKRFRLPPDAEVVGMVANFSPVKDHGLFLRMAGELIARRPKVHFILVGTGPLRELVWRTVQRRGWQKHFTRLSTVGEVADLLGVMDVAVLTSKVEGFPNAVMEAMASCTPPVAAAVGGVPELIRNEETGLLVDSREPADFAAAVARLLDDPILRKNMGTRAGQWVREHFTVERLLEEHRLLYHALLRSKLREGD